MAALSPLQSEHVAQRLREESIIWLTTVNDEGQPQSSPVWFLWDGSTFLIYSRPDQKVRNIGHHPRVSLHLDDDGAGGDIVTIEGDADLDPGAPPAAQNSGYREKYRQGIARLGMDAERFAAAYSRAIRVLPARVRVW